VIKIITLVIKTQAVQLCEEKEEHVTATLAVILLITTVTFISTKKIFEKYRKSKYLYYFAYIFAEWS